MIGFKREGVKNFRFTSVWKRDLIFLKQYEFYQEQLNYYRRQQKFDDSSFKLKKYYLGHKYKVPKKVTWNTRRNYTKY